MSETTAAAESSKKKKKLRTVDIAYIGLFAALITGALVQKFGHKFWQLILFMVIGLTVCYAFGTVWFIIAYKATLKAALATCVAPFLLPECGKILLAALLTNRLIRFVK